MSQSRAGFTPVAFLTPALALYAGVVLLPVACSVYFSFFQGSVSGSMSYVGLDNFAKILSDRIFFQSLLHNFILAFASIIIQIPIALCLAIAFQKNSKLFQNLRALSFSPMILPSAVVAIIFMLLYNPIGSPVSEIFEVVGVSSPAWLGDEAWVLPSLIAAISWRYIGFHMILILAAVQGVDRTLYEAASLDGANPWQQLLHITLPAIKPTLLLCTLLSVLGSLKYFDLVYIMTSGGPNHASELLSTYLYSLANSSNRFGYSSSVATALLITSVLVGIILFAFSKKRARV